MKIPNPRSRQIVGEVLSNFSRGISNPLDHNFTGSKILIYFDGNAVI